jgi:hypothetical protein
LLRCLFLSANNAIYDRYQGIELSLCFVVSALVLRGKVKEAVNHFQLLDLSLLNRLYASLESHVLLLHRLHAPLESRLLLLNGLHILLEKLFPLLAAALVVGIAPLVLRSPPFVLGLILGIPRFVLRLPPFVLGVGLGNPGFVFLLPAPILGSVLGMAHGGRGLLL